MYLFYFVNTKSKEHFMQILLNGDQRLDNEQNLQIYEPS